MTTIILHGCNGKMGQAITQLIKNNDQLTIVAGIDPYDGITNTYPVYPQPEACNLPADVIIDFSNALAVPNILTYAVDTHTPIVVCTTGLDNATKQLIETASQQVALLFSANMSLGINLLINLARKATAILTDANFDIEIIEKHHNQKLDAPSGTALAIAENLNKELDPPYTYSYDRSTQRTKRSKKEIGLHAIRGGTIVGEHEVLFAGEDELFSIEHVALSKRVFAVGAINAAKFLKAKTPKLYTMEDLMSF